MTLTLKAAKRVLLAAGYDESEISELVRGIKADAWDKGADETRLAFNSNPDMNLFVLDANPYRKAPPNYTEGATK